MPQCRSKQTKSPNMLCSSCASSRSKPSFHTLSYSRTATCRDNQRQHKDHDTVRAAASAAPNANANDGAFPSPPSCVAWNTYLGSTHIPLLSGHELQCFLLKQGLARRNLRHTPPCSHLLRPTVQFSRQSLGIEGAAAPLAFQVRHRVRNALHYERRRGGLQRPRACVHITSGSSHWAGRGQALRPAGGAKEGGGGGGGVRYGFSLCACLQKKPKRQDALTQRTDCDTCGSFGGAVKEYFCHNCDKVATWQTARVCSFVQSPARHDCKCTATAPPSWDHMTATAILPRDVGRTEGHNGNLIRQQREHSTRQNQPSGISDRA